MKESEPTNVILTRRLFGFCWIVEWRRVWHFLFIVSAHWHFEWNSDREAHREWDYQGRGCRGMMSPSCTQYQPRLGMASLHDGARPALSVPRPAAGNAVGRYFNDNVLFFRGAKYDVLSWTACCGFFRNACFNIGNRNNMTEFSLILSWPWHCP